MKKSEILIKKILGWVFISFGIIFFARGYYCYFDRALGDLNTGKLEAITEYKQRIFEPIMTATGILMIVGAILLINPRPLPQKVTT